MGEQSIAPVSPHMTTGGEVRVFAGRIQLSAIVDLLRHCANQA